MLYMHRHRWPAILAIKLGAIWRQHFGDGGSQRVSMRSLLKLGLATTFAATLLFGNVSISPAQQIDEANELNKKVIELYNAGRYSDATPLAQQILSIEKRCSVATTPMSASP